MSKLITIFCCLVAIGLGFAPANVQSWVRATVRDALSPGVRLAADMREFVAAEMQRRLLGDEAGDQAQQISNLKFEITNLEQQLRRERLLARRNQRKQLLALQRHDESHRPIDPPPLIVPQVVQASVLGEELAALWRSTSGKVLDRGRSQGMTESALVLESNVALLDQGADSGLAPDLPVFAGSCVIGKLQHVGRWSSTWLPLTDKRFRGRARLARLTTDGLVFKGEGVLVGNGKNKCLLTKISSTEEPVSEGDEVFSLETPGGFGTPLFYGTVTRAELAAGATHWEIEVSPAVDPLMARSVCVVRPQVNPKRLAN